MNRLLIIGSGITGMTTGYECAQLGAHVDVVERSSVAGGKILEYCCKATDSCSRCGVCVAHTQIHDSLNRDNLDLHVGATIESFSNTGKKVAVRIAQQTPIIDYGRCVSCDACVDACPVGCISKIATAELVQYRIDYDACLLRKGEKCTACSAACGFDAINAEGDAVRKSLSAEGVLVATGHEPYSARGRARFGYGRSKNIITGAEAEEILSRESSLGDPGESVAFIQCVGSRDPVIGRNFCSAVCCAYALRLARMLKYRNTDADVTVYYIDLQNFDKTFSVLKKEIEGLGVKLIRGLPFRVDELADGRLRLMRENTDGEEEATTHDKVVLSVGMEPAAGAESVAELFGLNVNEFGFFESSHANVFVGGTCREPQSIPDSIATAKAIAASAGGGAE